MTIDQIALGEWLRVWNPGHTSQMIGQVVGFGVYHNHRTGSIEGRTVLIENKITGAAVREADIIEKFDPVAEWQRLFPDQPLSEWMQGRLTWAETAAKQSQ